MRVVPLSSGSAESSGLAFIEAGSPSHRGEPRQGWCCQSYRCEPAMISPQSGWVFMDVLAAFTSAAWQFETVGLCKS